MQMSQSNGNPCRGRCGGVVSILMYCLQWLIPVLLIPKPVNAALMHTHAVFVALYLVGFFLERKPCAICSLLFLAVVFFICHSGLGLCLFWANHCDIDRCTA